MNKKIEATTTKKPTEYIDVSASTIDTSEANVLSLTELLKSKKPASATLRLPWETCRAVRHAIVKLTGQKATCYDDNATHSVEAMGNIVAAHNSAFIKLELIDTDSRDEGCTMLFNELFGLNDKEASALANQVNEAQFKSEYFGASEGLLSVVNVSQVKYWESVDVGEKFISWTGPNHLLNFIG